MATFVVNVGIWDGSLRSGSARWWCLYARILYGIVGCSSGKFGERFGVDFSEFKCWAREAGGWEGGC